MKDEQLEDYYREAESWSEDRLEATQRSLRLAWIAAGVAALIAVVEAFALVALIPLKREVPFIQMVDSQTGHIERINPWDNDTLTADAALTRSLLVQYVVARESFDIDNAQEDHRKVGLWSADEARNQYLALMNSSNPQSPLATLPRRATVAVQIRSVSSLSRNSAMVRFSTVRTDPGGRPQVAQHWAALITYRFSDADMTAGDRLTNPLGFQVTRYRRDPETLPEALPAALPEAPPIPSTVDDGEPAAPEPAL